VYGSRMVLMTRVERRHRAQDEHDGQDRGGGHHQQADGYDGHIVFPC